MLKIYSISRLSPREYVAFKKNPPGTKKYPAATLSAKPLQKYFSHSLPPRNRFARTGLGKTLPLTRSGARWRVQGPTSSSFRDLPARSTRTSRSGKSVLSAKP